MEKWRAIVGYEGYYEVSSIGRIRSLNRAVQSSYDRQRTIKGRIRKPVVNKQTGYPTIMLSRENKSKTVTIHRLVAFAFIPAQVGKNEINHIDANRENNDWQNLEWCTRKENCRHAIALGRVDNRNFIEAGNKARRKPVEAISITTGVRKLFASTMDAERAGFDSPNVSRCCLGKARTHGGHRWRHLTDVEAKAFS